MAKKFIGSTSEGFEVWEGASADRIAFTDAKPMTIFIEGANTYRLENGTWNQISSGGAGHTKEQGRPGSRNPDSAGNHWTPTHEEVNKTLFDPNATTEQVITNAPALFYGFIERTGVGTLTIRDDSAANGATSPFKTFTLGTDKPLFPFGIRMENGITAQCGTGTDDCTIFWRAL